MGLGGYLTWTAVSREIVESGKAKKTLPCEIHGHHLKIVDSDIWKNNPYMTTDYQDFRRGDAILLQLNNHATAPCSASPADKASIIARRALFTRVRT